MTQLLHRRPSVIFRVVAVSLTLTMVVASPVISGVESDSEAVTDRESVKNSKTSERVGTLAPLNGLIGEWRGVGQPKRGSRSGAWIETLECRWDFSGETPTLLIKSTKSKQFQTLKLTQNTATEKVILKETLTDGTTRTYHGTWNTDDSRSLILQTDASDSEAGFRCTITQLSDIRATILFETRTTKSAPFRRIAGIGYTQAGKRLAVAGGPQRKCIVTGGRGTMAVQHDGKTWYVCCEGCRQAFEAAPEEIIAEYRASLKQSTEE